MQQVSLERCLRYSTLYGVIRCHRHELHMFTAWWRVCLKANLLMRTLITWWNSKIHRNVEKVYLFRRMPPSGMWRRVHLVITDVSKEHVASIFRVEKYTRARKRVRRLLTDLDIITQQILSEVHNFWSSSLWNTAPFLPQSKKTPLTLLWTNEGRISV
jgi:hypothetical protein